MQLELGPYQVKFGTRAVRPDRVNDMPRRRGVVPRVVLTASLAGLAMVVAGPASSAFAGGGGGGNTATATISVAVRSVTVSIPTFSFGGCQNNGQTGNTLVMPDGTCVYPVGSETPLTVINGSAPAYIDIEGSNAVPSDAGTNWTLCNANVSGSCSGPAAGSATLPGVNQYNLEGFGPGGGEVQLSSTVALCDMGFSTDGETCSEATSGESQNETINLTGPSSSTDGSSTFTTVITWTAAPSPGPA